MQFTISINQAKSIEWGLSSQQAVLFAFVYSCPSWCNPVVRPDGVYFALSKQKIVQELPILTDKPDTAYRILKQLQKVGVIEISSTPHITLVRLTDKGKTWNIKGGKVGKKSEEGRKIIRQISIPVIRIPIIIKRLRQTLRLLVIKQRIHKSHLNPLRHQRCLARALLTKY